MEVVKHKFIVIFLYRMRIVLLIVVCLAVVWWIRQSGAESAQAGFANDVITGYWSAPADFCLKAKLTSMHLMVSAVRRDNTRLTHLAATGESGKPIADDFGVLRISTESGWRRWLPTSWNAQNEKDWVRFSAQYKSENAQSLFPAELDLLVNPRTGQMRLHGKKKVWAVLDRETAASQVLTEKT
jgi:hypothetical protein